MPNYVMPCYDDNHLTTRKANTGFRHLLARCSPRQAAVQRPLAGRSLLAAGLMLGAFSAAQASDASAFVTTWQTTEPNEEIAIPTAPYTDYDFTID